MDQCAGFIAASCGQLESVMQKSDHVSRALLNGMSNGKPPMMKVQQNGRVLKCSNGSMNGVYSNFNGMHY